MKNGFFARKDEVVLSTFTALIVFGLAYQGISALRTGREHSIFPKDQVSVSKK